VIILVLLLPGVVQIGIIELIFLLAPLVIVPLALPFVAETGHGRAGEFLFGLVRVTQPVGAVGAIMAFLLPGGLMAAIAAGGWLLVTVLMALIGLIRLWRRGLRLQPEALCVDAGLLFLPIGAGWLVLARLGANPLGFGDIVVLLTAVHFHYAGFAAPIMTSLTGQALPPTTTTTKWLYRVTAGGVIGGTPLVAAGITFSPLLELIGAIVLATSLISLAYLLTVIVLPGMACRPAQVLLGVSAGSLVVGMLLTYAFAFSEFSGHYLINIPHMARFHGPANAVGFALCGLAGWNLLRVQGQKSGEDQTTPSSRPTRANTSAP
jgi:hypothetical protein